MPSANEQNKNQKKNSNNNKHNKTEKKTNSNLLIPNKRPKIYHVYTSIHKYVRAGMIFFFLKSTFTYMPHRKTH